MSRTAAAVAQASHSFDGSRHPRGDHGRFAAEGASHAERHAHNVHTLAQQGVLPTLRRRPDGSVVEHALTTSKTISGPTPRAPDGAPQEPTNHVIPLDERRTRATMPGYYRIASKTPGMPVHYTGSSSKEQPVGSFKVHQLTDQRPKVVSPRDHIALRARLGRIVAGQAEGTIAAGKLPKRRGKLRGETLIPEGTPEHTVRRAYAHAAATALHNYGVINYDFAMDDALKQELQPLHGFMLFAKRRVMDTMFANEKGGYAPYRAELGETFHAKRNGKLTGVTRQRMSPRTQMIKAEPMGSLRKAYDASKHPREHDGQFSRKLAENGLKAAVGAAGGFAGIIAGRRYGGILGGKTGRFIGAKFGGIGKKGLAWQRSLSHDFAEIYGAHQGHKLGTKFGPAVAGTAGAIAGAYAGGKIGRLVDDHGRKQRAKKAGKLMKAYEEVRGANRG